MSKLKFLRKISNKERYLIDFSNLKDNIFPHQKINSSKSKIDKIISFPEKGIPILFPKNLSFFLYKKNNQIFLDKKKILQKIFLSQNNDYPPFKNFVNSGETFYTNVSIKKKFINTINQISTYNKIAIKKIKILNKKYKQTCSFQTRNIPHLGHEKIIEQLLERFDHVVINPLIGPKKKGDVKFEILEKSYQHIIEHKFKNRVSYIPIIANMFYAGPREALHHANIRKSLGFKNFVVGRDHAGAFNNYRPLDAYKLVSKYKKKLKINTINLKGAYFCKDCKNIVINFSCNHKNYQNISGTDFRKKLNNKKLFNFADKDLQKKLHKIKVKLFV